MASTFEDYAERLEARRLAPGGVAASDAVATAIGELDAAVAAVEGHGFEPTPFAPAPELAEAVGIGDAELWIKDETGNVSGSHKARHLFGVALAHRLGASDGDSSDAAPYAIASCGNAALAAAVVARAVGRRIDVFVPTWANEAVVDRITELGGRVVRCERRPGVPGDPAHHAMLAAIEAGAVPFSCQGTETPATIDGGRTLAWEMVDALIEHDGGAPARLDRLFVQVGGGALATAVVTGLAAAVDRGDLARLPVVHAVQPQGNHPLVRAWDTLALESLTPERAPNTRDSSYFLDRIVRAQAVPTGALDNGRRAAIAESIGPATGERLQELVDLLRYDPERYMRAWEKEPVSYASGILDDITYDWVDVVEAMLATGGWPLVASEDDFRQAHRLAHEHTGIDVCPTGASGLGGLLALTAASGGSGSTGMSPGERVAVLFTGQMRPGDADPLEAERTRSDS
ncbi:MAG: pyridoxal-phosphate dependent enzyme [Acidimicrobiia bacterium]|nr:pyridoxal-phosphate dependent enzyme [Acidimicrobiia bacterium]